MKLSNPKGSDIQDLGLTVLGIVGGAVLGRAAHARAITLITAPSDTVKLGIRAGLLGVSGYGAAALKGTDSTSKMLKNIAIGMGGIQLIDGVKEVASKNTTVAGYASGTGAKKVIAQSLGLGCPCENTALMALPLNRPNSRRRRLNGASLVQRALGTPNYLQDALTTGAY